MTCRWSAYLLAAMVALAFAAPAEAGFGIADFDVSVRNANGTIDELAATHPSSLDVHLAMNTGPDGRPDGVLRAIQLDLPPGLIGNALAYPRCSLAEFESGLRCAGATQVGVLRGIVSELGQVSAPIYNLAPGPGHAAAFGVSLNGSQVIQRLRLIGRGSSSSIRMAADLPSSPAIVDVEEEIWGVPAAPAHDSERFCRSGGGGVVEGCPSSAEERPLLTLPAACAEPMRTVLAATSVDPVPLTAMATALSRDAGGNPRPLFGCEAVPFEPLLTVRTEAAALAPTPLALALEVPQYEGAGASAAASLARARIALPVGVALNPSAGSWLAACTIVLDDEPDDCPAGSRIGSVRAWTPMAGHALLGSVYLASPAAGPPASGLAIYLVVEDADSGTLLKMPGWLVADAGDGHLTAMISDLPLFPLGELEIEFAGGPRAVLVNPPRCGRFTAEATFTPSTAPFATAVTRGAGFTLVTGENGGPCPPPEAERNAVPSFSAGVDAPAAGRDSSLAVDLSRADLDQHFGSFDLTLPPGLSAVLGGTPVGAAVGSVGVSAGLGPRPLSLQGTAYLGGPYRGAPFSLEIVVPAKAGPLDLGTIVQRAALEVDPVTARISVRGDPLPRILGGVPLEVRGVSLDLDRPGFIRNPTSCEPMAITGTATTSLGQVAPLSDRFQVGGCAALPFKPKLSLTLSGALGRGGHPAVRAVYRGEPSGAAPARMAFGLPPGELLDLRHLGRLCPRGVAGERCPRGSRLGSLRIDTPMLDAPLEGPVYLRVPSRRLPDLTAEVRGGGLRFLLRGRTTDRGGRLGVSLDSLPDVPLSRAVLTLPGGRRGIVVNSESLCLGKRHGVADFSAHSGKQRRLRVPVRLGDGC